MRPPPLPTGNLFQPKTPKFDLTHFDGNHAPAWLFQVEQYFAFYGIQPNQRILVPSYFMTGEALNWFQWMHCHRLLSDWDSFARAVEEFEILSNRVTSLSDDHLLNLFISGLKHDIQQEVVILNPRTLTHAFGLAKLIEAKFVETRPRNYRGPSLTSSSFATLLSNSKAPSPSFYQIRPDIATELLPLSEIPLPPPPPLPTGLQLPEFQVSLHALYGLSSHSCLKLTGTIKGHSFTILVDSGSTHNLIQPRDVKYLGLSVEPPPPLTVKVGNGEVLRCSGKISALPVVVQGLEFTLDLFLLDVHGADIILGIQWLAQLGPILADFGLMRMSFDYKRTWVTLTGQQPLKANCTTAHQVQRLTQTKGLHSAHLLTLVDSVLPESPPPSPTLAIETSTITELLNRYHVGLDSHFWMTYGLILQLSPKERHWLLNVVMLLQLGHLVENNLQSPENPTTNEDGNKGRNETELGKVSANGSLSISHSSGNGARLNRDMGKSLGGPNLETPYLDDDSTRLFS
ncbi:Retroviral aspartyl protease [Corchorus olitorius]|uniref:Retroviral aspartyl protease n=1 Tax=Corchorus olitorius TaxID=93759 RepID=A0A1R3KMY1_9ROSI|nr:Retroviral aspartyl protease [Corchorus olitorius]